MNRSSISKRSGTVLLLVALMLVGTWALAPGRATAGDNQSPVGEWKTIDDATGKPLSIVRIWEKGDKLFGKIDKLILEPGEDPAPVCDKCEGERKDKPIIGMTILWDLEKDDDEWSGGRILDPDNGETYKCYIEVVEGGKKLKVRGYVGFSLFGRTQYWVRAN